MGLKLGLDEPPVAVTIILIVAEIDLVGSTLSVAVMVAEYVPAAEGDP